MMLCPSFYSLCHAYVVCRLHSQHTSSMAICCILSSVYTVYALRKLTFYGRTTPTATGVTRSRLRAYFVYGYGRTTPTATGVLRLQLRAYRGYNYGRATGVLCGRV